MWVEYHHIWVTFREKGLLLSELIALKFCILLGANHSARYM